jgi:hypothetical protein
MTSVHIIEDQTSDLEMIKDLLETSWKEVVPPKPNAVGWKYAWDLLKSGELERDDVVVADLYPTDYWLVAPPPKPVPQPSLPKDPTNFNTASIDMIKRFLRPIAEESAHLFVITYIPNWIENDLEIPVAAKKMRDILNAQPFEIIEKERKYDPEDCFRSVVQRVNEVLGL